MSKLTEYKTAKDNLKSLESAALTELQVKYAEALKNAKDAAQTLKEIDSNLNLDEIAEFIALIKIVDPKDAWKPSPPKPAGARRGRKPGSTNKKPTKAAKTGKKRKTRGPNVKVSDEQILAFIKTQRTTGEVQAHFKLSPLTTGKKLAALVTAKKASVAKVGVKKFWTAK